MFMKTFNDRKLSLCCFKQNDFGKNNNLALKTFSLFIIRAKTK